MKRQTKTAWITAAVLMVAGLALFAAVMTAKHWDFTAFNTAKYETNEYEVTEAFQNVTIDIGEADIAFALSEDGTCKVIAYEREYQKHTVTVENQTLTIGVTDTRTLRDRIALFAFGSPKITVYLPESTYAALVITGGTGDVELPDAFAFKSIDVTVSTGDVTCAASAAKLLKLSANTGDLSVENTAAGTLELTVSTGKVTVSSFACKGEIKVKVSTGHAALRDVTCKNLTSTGSTGDIVLSNVIVSEAMTIERSTGDVTFDGCDAAEITVKTSTGDVEGSLLSEKVFSANSNTGRINVPQTASGGNCTISTGTGDIDITIR